MEQATRLLLVGQAYTETGTFAFTGDEAGGRDTSDPEPEAGECVRMRSLLSSGNPNQNQFIRLAS